MESQLLFIMSGCSFSIDLGDTPVAQLESIVRDKGNASKFFKTCSLWQPCVRMLFVLHIFTQKLKEQYERPVANDGDAFIALV